MPKGIEMRIYIVVAGRNEHWYAYKAFTKESAASASCDGYNDRNNHRGLYAVIDETELIEDNAERS